MLNGGATEARRSFLSRRGRDGPGPAASRVSRRENRLLARDASVETREGLRTSDFGLPGPLTTNN